MAGFYAVDRLATRPPDPVEQHAMQTGASSAARPIDSAGSGGGGVALDESYRSIDAGSGDTALSASLEAVDVDVDGGGHDTLQQHTSTQNRPSSQNNSPVQPVHLHITSPPFGGSTQISISAH